MKKFLLIFMTILAVMFLSFLLFIKLASVKPGPVVEIGTDVITAQQLLPYVKEYMKQYEPKRTFLVSTVYMYLDKNHKGEVQFDFVEDKENKPRSYSVYVSTTEHTIYEVVRDVQYVPALTGLENWAIDSDKAVEIAKKILKEHGYDVVCDRIGITGNFRSEGYCWGVRLAQKAADDNYAKYDDYPAVVINASTGELVRPIKEKS